MKTRALLALSLAALAAWLSTASPTPEPTPAPLADDEAEWRRDEQELFMCTIGYVQC